MNHYHGLYWYGEIGGLQVTKSQDKTITYIFNNVFWTEVLPKKV